MKGRLNRAEDRSFLQRGTRALGRGLREAGYATALGRLRLRGLHPLRLESTFRDPWHGDRNRGTALLNGSFEFAGHTENGSDDDIWESAEKAPPAFRDWMFGFEWMRDLREAGPSRASRLFLESMSRAFLARYTNWRRVAWAPENLGRRHLAWCGHADELLASGDMVYRSALLDQFARETRHLTRVVGDAAPGPGRVAAATGLLVSGLVLREGAGATAKGSAALESALRNFVLADGGGRSRKPRDLISIARNLVALQGAYRAAEERAPEWVQIHLDRIVPFLKGVSHGDGTPAQFHGAFGAEDSDLAALYAQSGATGRAIMSAHHSGYHRLKERRCLVIVDAGPPPARRESMGAHASALAFEMSDGPDRCIVNIGGTVPGWGEAGAELNRLAATTAGHSSLVIGDRNNAEIRADGTIGVGATGIDFERNEDDTGTYLSARHDGYSRLFSVVHERQLHLARDGMRLDGKDRLEATPAGRKPHLGRHVDIRFHLHPDVSASPTRDGSSIILRLAHGNGWTFRAEGGEVALEESIYSDRPGRSRRTSQIRIALQLDKLPLEVGWSFIRLSSRP